MFDLKRHKKSKHDGVKYSCDLCSHVAAQVGSLIEHKRSKHEGVRYPCDQCDYAATHRSNLVKHKKSKHEGVKYLCDQCPYVATQLPKLKAHKQNKHEGKTIIWFKWLIDVWSNIQHLFARSVDIILNIPYVGEIFQKWNSGGKLKEYIFCFEVISLPLSRKSFSFHL